MDDYNRQINGNTNNLADDEYLFVEEGVYDVGYDPNPDTKDIKEVVGSAISGIPGVLALKGGLADIFKAGEDLTRGVSVRKSEDGRVAVKVKVIAESGYEHDQLIQRMTEAITDDLQTQMGLYAAPVEVEVAETMTQNEFFDKYDADRALH